MNEGQPRYQQMDFGLTGDGRPNTLNGGAARMDNDNPNDGAQAEQGFGRENAQAAEFRSEMRNIFRDQALAGELNRGHDNPHDNPNINPDARGVTTELQAALRRLNGLIEGIDPADRVGKFEILGDFISKKDQLLGQPGDQKEISDTSRKILFEMLVEKIIGFPDISPDSHYQTQIGDIYTQGNLTTLKNFASSSRFVEPEGSENTGKNMFGRYIGELSEIRQTSHDLRLNLSLGDNYKKFIQEGLKSRGIDFISNHLAGVREVINLYEIHTPRRLSETKSWFQDEDVRKIDASVRRSLQSVQTSNQLTSHGRPLTSWEMERALNIGKTIFRGTQRMAMYATMGNVPPNAESRIGSVPDEYIARSLQGYKITAMRFFYETENQALHRRVLNQMAGEKAGYDVDNTESMFGVNKDAWIVNGKGAPDLQSHSWRMGLLFLGDILLKDAGQDRTLLQIIDEVTSQEFKARGLGYHPDVGWGHIPEGSPIREEIEEAIAHRMEDAILGQTMYLSALVRNENVHSSLKEKIWKKIGVYDPLAIATLRPDIIAGLTPMERAIWEGSEQRDGLAEKLVLGNLIRLKKEGAKYRDEHGDARAITRGELLRESIQFKGNISEDTREKIMRNPASGGYFGADYGNELSGSEAELLKKILRMTSSDEVAKKLSSTKLPYTVFMDDMPHVAWAKTGHGGAGLADEDGFRLLISDQPALAEGWGAMNTLLENPASAKVQELLQTAVEKWAGVRGRPAAQKEIEPFIIAYLQMAETTRVAEWIGSAQKALKMPRSEMEEFFRTSFISLDASERNLFLEGLSKNGVISSAVADGVNFSQLERLKKKARVNGKEIAYDRIREFIQAILPVIGVELGKGLTEKLGDVLKT